MSDTVGALIDKLFTVDMKMWNNQELLYKIRDMSFEEFERVYMFTRADREALWGQLQKVCDLNMQRSALIDEIDLLLVEMIGDPDLDDGRYVQRKHKTY